jgi:hypothetical protein
MSHDTRHHNYDITHMTYDTAVTASRMIGKLTSCMISHDLWLSTYDLVNHMTLVKPEIDELITKIAKYS